MTTIAGYISVGPSSSNPGTMSNADAILGWVGTAGGACAAGCAVDTYMNSHATVRNSLKLL